MPTIGGVFVPDSLMPSIDAPPTPRPSLGAIFGGAAQQAYGQLRYGLPYAIEKSLGTANASDEASYQQGLKDSAVAANAAAPAQLSDLTSGKVGLTRFIAENFVGSAPQTLSGIAGSIIGARLGGARGAVAGGLSALTPQFVGSNVDRSVQETGGLTAGGAARALLTAPVQAASDLLVERYLPGAGHVVGDLAATQTGGFLTRTIKSVLKAGATEAVAESAQQLGERFSAGLPVSSPDAAKEYVNAAVTAFAVGGVLGAGGGFRRTEALRKAPGDLTTDDMLAHVDEIVSPKPALTPTQNPTYPAPIPGQSTTRLAIEDQRGPITVGPEGTAITPDQRAAALDPAVLAQPDITEQGALDRLEAARALAQGAEAPGRQIDNARSALQDVLAGRDPSIPPALRAPTPAIDPAAAVDALASSGGVSPLAIDARGEFNGTAEPVQIDPGRLFNDQPIADLNTALKAKKASPEIKAAAQEELHARWAEAAGVEPLTGDFKTRLEELKDGLRGSFVSKLDATDSTDLVKKVYDEVFENQNTASSVTKLAQRLGIIDDKLEPTQMANDIEAQRTAAAQAEAAPAPARPAPVTTVTPAADPGFKWDALKAEAGISRSRDELKAIGTPVSLEDAHQKVFAALATDSSDAQVSQVEKLAKKMGLVTNDDFLDITPLGRKTFLKSGEGLDETVRAAQQQGYTGAQASIFERGARAQVDGAETVSSHSSFADVAAYEAGKAWAKDQINNPGVKSGAASAAIAERLATRQSGTAVDKRSVERAALTPAQLTQQSLNRTLDALDLRTTSDSDVAALRRMVRDGASVDEVTRAVEQVQGGKTLFAQPEAAPATLSPLPTRGQPTFKEMNTPEAGPGKAEQRAQSEPAVRAFKLRSLIDFAASEKGITTARAQKLHSLLDQGKTDQVARNLKDFDPDGKAAFGTNQFGYADPKLEAALTGKTFDEAAQYMADNAPSHFQAAVMEKVLETARTIEKAGGHSFELKVVNPGDTAPRIINHPDLMAYTLIHEVPDAKASVYLKSARMSPEVGTNYQMAAHEMLHAVTMQAIDYASQTDPTGKTRLGEAVRDLNDLFVAVKQHLNDRLDNISSNGLEARAGGGDFGKLEFELQHQLGEHNAFADPHELLAWGMTNPAMQRYLQSIEYKPRQSVFSRLVELVRNMLGLDAKHDTALTELVRVAEQVMTSSATDLAPVFARSDPDFGEQQVAQAAAGRAGITQQASTVAGANDLLKSLGGLTEKVTDSIPVADLGVKARRTALGWISQNHMDREFGAAMPGLLARSDAKRAHDAIQGRFAGMGDESYQGSERLERANPAAAERLNKLMSLSTEFKVDPDKAFDDHAHLKDDANIAALRRKHAEAVALKNDLSRGDGAGYKLFTEVRQRNEAINYARLAGELHSLVALDPEFSLGVANANVNPMDTFMTQPGLSTAAAIHNFWNSALQDQIKAAMTFVNAKKGEVRVAGSEADIRGVDQHLSPIEQKITATYEALAGMARAPYFHLGRFGDNFGSATIRKLPGGGVDPKAQEHVAKVLADAGFTNVQISTDNNRPKFSTRFDTVDQTNRFKALALQLQKQGWLDQEEKVLAGPRDLEQNYGVADGMPAFVQKYIASIEANPMFVPDEGMSATEKAALAERKAEAVQLARDTWISQQPDSAISKVLTARHTVPGYYPDMMRNFAHQWTVSASNLARVATSAQLGKAYEDMRAQKLQALDATDPGNADRLNDVFNEVRKRDANRPLDPSVDTFDKLRALSHSYFLGFSPAYGMVNMTQLGVTALPELAKTAGYAKSFHAMRRASVTAFAIMNAARKDAFALGPKNAADVVLTESVLGKAGLNAKQADFMRHMIATGTIDIGTSARALGQVAKGQGHTKLDTYLKYAGAVGLYTETFSRLVTALAAHELHGGTTQEAAKFATKVVSNSMFDYQSWNTARQLGKQGFAGPITPLLTQFMQYSAQVTEKLYSEIHDAVGRARPGETTEQTAARKAASRTFLAGHLTAVTALAGTLGLPFASVFATVVEKMFGSADQPLDATAAYRNFLASILGSDAAEVLSRGLPRAVGIDLSSRTGEQDLLPFSKLLGDRRSWREAISSTLGRSAGAAPDMLLNVADAGGQFSNGDILGGMKSLVPVAFKGPVEAYRMTEKGYIDTKGNKLPMTPGASAVLTQLLGFSPAEKAEYSEARQDQTSRRLTLTDRANTLRQGIIRAMVGGDMDRAKELISDAQSFDEANPSFAVVPSLAGALQRQQQSAAKARALSSPLGVPINDLAGQQLTRYANVNYQ